jgi:diamine N-acetyltransferase
MLLTGKHIRLRALEPEDLEVLYTWENDTAAWLVSGTLTPFSRFVLTQYLASSHQDIYSSRQLRLVIEKTAEGKPIGCIDLFDFDPKNKRAGVGILIGDHSERSRGYASEALSILVNYAFSILDLHQLYCNVTVDNDKSLRLFVHQGFEVCGTRRDWIYNSPHWLDEYMLQLVRLHA